MASSIDVGSTFDAYEILALLARGGMANVWLARQRMKHGLETLVAIKTVLPEFSMDPKFQTMFLDEARIACRIDHPNVARLLDVGEAFGHSYIVMEYVGGESLSRLRRVFARANEMLPLALALRVIADLCAGLHAAHELVGSDGQLLHVVHRDVSPQNLLLGDSGVVKLIDFGVAKARGRLGAETSAGFAKGKARYMAPEQASGLAVDRRADVFAAGAVLYELLVGRSPMDGPNDMAVLKNLVGDAPVEPLPASVPGPVRALVARALEKAPEARFPTAAAMRDAIEEAMSQLGLRASTGEIERVLRENLAERIAERRQAIEQAMRAADARAVGSRVPVVDESSADLLRPSQPDEASLEATARAIPPTRRRWWPVPVVGVAILAGAVIGISVRESLVRSAPTEPSIAPSTVLASTAVASTLAVTATAPSPSTSVVAPQVTASPSDSAGSSSSVAPRGSQAPRPRSTGAKPVRSTHDWGGIE